MYQNLETTNAMETNQNYQQQNDELENIISINDYSDNDEEFDFDFDYDPNEMYYALENEKN